MRVLGFSGVGAIAVVAGALLGSQAPAFADIQYTNFEVANDVNVTLTCNSIANCTSGYYGSGQIDLYNNSSSPIAEIWCVDVTHDLGGPWSSSAGSGVYAFNVTHWANDGGGLSNIWSGGAAGLGTQLTNRVVGEIGALARYGDANLNTDYNVSSAVQLAIWDVEYNKGSLSLGGALTETSDSSATQSLAETLVSEATHGKLGFDTNVDWLTCGSLRSGACNQGQIEVLPRAVPEPSALALLGSGLLAAAGATLLRRRRRNFAPTA